MRRWIGVVVVIACLVLATGCLHEIKPLVEGASLANAFAINDRGVVVGQADLADGQQTSHAFLADGDGPPVDLTPDRADDSVATGIDADGVVAGTIMRGDDRGDRHPRVFVWTRGELEVLDPPPGITSASAVAMNDGGQVLVDAQTTSTPWEAYVWDRHTRQYTQVPRLRADGDIIPRGLNDRGAVVGLAHTPDQLWAPVIWDRASPGGRVLPHDGYRAVQPQGVNDAGVVVGYADDQQTGEQVALYWPADGSGPVRLRVNPGETAGAMAISDTGRIVGFHKATEPSPRATAIYWHSESGPPVRLEDREGWSQAYDVNNAGRAAGLAERADRRQVAVWWDAPDPPVA